MGSLQEECVQRSECLTPSAQHSPSALCLPQPAEAQAPGEPGCGFPGGGALYLDGGKTACQNPGLHSEEQVGGGGCRPFQTPSSVFINIVLTTAPPTG